MLQHLWWDLGERASGACFEVELRGSPARVCLMDGDEYEAYCRDDNYEAYGGFYDVTPVELVVPYDDYWFLVVDSNNQRVKVNWTEIFED